MSWYLRAKGEWISRSRGSDIRVWRRNACRRSRISRINGMCPLRTLHYYAVCVRCCSFRERIQELPNSLLFGNPAYLNDVSGMQCSHCWQEELELVVPQYVSLWWASH